VLQIWAKLDREALEDMNPYNFKNFKTDVFKTLKEWDKRYMKHMKSAHVDLSHIQKESMLPLTNLLQSNYNFHCINQLISKEIMVPDFRFKALECKFVQHMTRICELFRDFGKLKEHFDI